MTDLFSIQTTTMRALLSFILKEIYMDRIFIDFDKFNTVDEIHNWIKDKLNFPDYYGKNLDALYDCLTDVMEPLVIEYATPKGSNEEFVKYAERFIKVLQSASAHKKNIEVICLSQA